MDKGPANEQLEDQEPHHIVGISRDHNAVLLWYINTQVNDASSPKSHLDVESLDIGSLRCVSVLVSGPSRSVRADCF